MLKRIVLFVGPLLLATMLIACSSPEEKAAGYIKGADKLFEQGDLKKAEIEYRNALQINQNLADAWYGLGRIYDQRHEWKKEYAVLNKIRELAPQHLEGRMLLGKLLAVSDQLDEALAEARDILEMAPDDTRSHSLMAFVQYRLGNFEGARDEADKALALDANNSDALLTRARVLIVDKRFDDALTELDEAIGKNPDNSLFYQMKIQVFSKMGDNQSIEKVYLELIERFPKNVDFKQALARHYIAEEDIESAEHILQKVAEAGDGTVDDKLRFVDFKLQHRSIDDAIALVKSYIETDKSEFRYRFLLGGLYEKADQNDKAIGVYQEIIGEDGEQPAGLEARNKIALIELRSGNRDRAVELTNEVLALDKSNENALLMQAGFQLIDNNLDDVIVSARTVLRDNPDSIRALALLGRAYEGSGSKELAIETYTRAFQLSPGTPDVANRLAGFLILQGKAAQADEILQTSLSKGNRSIASIRLLTQAKLALGEWGKAEQLARQLQKVEGQESVSQQFLGVAYLGMERQEESITAFKRAHELSPESSQPVIALVQTYARSGKYDEARRFLDAILEVDDDNFTAHMMLGELSLATDHTSEAIIHFRSAIDVNPESVEGYRRLAYTYSRREEMDKAENTIQEALTRIPDNPLLFIHLAAINEKKGEYEKAINIYESLLEKDKGSLIAKNNLAGLLTDHRSDQASFDRARVLSSEFKNSEIPQFRDTYAWASVVAGTNLEEAVVILEGIVRDNDNVGIYAYHLGEAYWRKGDSKNAIAWLEKAANLGGPDSDIAKKARQTLQQIK